MSSNATRLDQALVDRGLSESREKAKRAILAGLVLLNGQPATKPGTRTRPADQINVAETEKYVSRGGHKLEHGLANFDVSPHGLACVDLGASTGGFTDCLLQHGASRVYAVDVGRGQLAWKLRNHPAVVVLEQTNARDLTPALMPKGFEPVQLAVIDCSFISLRKILPAAVALLSGSGKIIALVKPQFEAGKAEADRGQGVITDPLVHARVLEEIRLFAEQNLGMVWRACTESPLLGPAGNKEFLVLLERS